MFHVFDGSVLKCHEVCVCFSSRLTLLLIADDVRFFCIIRSEWCSTLQRSVCCLIICSVRSLSKDVMSLLDY